MNVVKELKEPMSMTMTVDDCRLLHINDDDGGFFLRWGKCQAGIRL